MNRTLPDTLKLRMSKKNKERRRAGTETETRTEQTPTPPVEELSPYEQKGLYLFPTIMTCFKIYQLFTLHREKEMCIEHMFCMHSM